MSEKTRNELHWNIWNFFATIAVPWLIFMFIVLLFGFEFQNSFAIVWAMVAVLFGLSILIIVVDSRTGKERPWSFKGVICLLSCALGVLVGLYAWEKWLATYWTAQQARLYTNVLPSEPAAAHQDAGVISFAEGSTVGIDIGASFTMLYKYCVAPIVWQDAVPSGQAAQYWAVGLDCCNMRSGFMCNDALNINAHAGLVMMDASFLFPTDRQMYMSAVEQAASVNGIIAADNPVLLYFYQDPDKVLSDMYTSAIYFILVALAVYLACLIVSVGVLYMGAKGYDLFEMRADRETVDARDAA